MSSTNNFNQIEFDNQVEKAIKIIKFTEDLDPNAIVPQSSGFERSQEEAEEIVNRADVKKIICPFLQSSINDVFELGKLLTAGLVAPIILGTSTVVIPINPILIAWMAIIIWKAGVTSICAE